MNDTRATARAIDALRRGWPVVIDDCIAVVAIETAGRDELAAFDPEGAANILITAGRAVTLKLANQSAAATPDAPVMIARTAWLDADVALALADPALDLAYPMKGPFDAVPCASLDASAAALILARHAGLLPAFYTIPGVCADAVRISAEAIHDYEKPTRLSIAARAKLPVTACEHAEIIAFRSPDAMQDHIALMIGSPNGTPPLVRLHSECLTGDVLGSLKCDCGPQLNEALKRIADHGWGILLYMRQEGRGIGLVNKVRAYALQDQGFDTVDANTRLGFAVDARDFGLAARMLKLLGAERINLLTNNPDKVAKLNAAGVEVIARIPHQLPANPHNAHYLATKRNRTGHALHPENEAP